MLRRRNPPNVGDNAPKPDAASKEQIQETAHRCVKELGRLDVAVANAGIARGGSVLDLSLKDWQDQVDINLRGVFFTEQAAAQLMVAAGNGGRLICMASLADPADPIVAERMRHAQASMQRREKLQPLIDER